MLIISVTVASIEINLSKLNLLKTYLRTTISKDILNELAMLSINKEMIQQLSYMDLINIFESNTTGRVVFM